MSTPNASPTDPSPRSGFTLLEVTISSMIFVTILAIMNQALVGTTLSQAQLQVASTLDADAHRFIDTIATEIANGAQVTIPAKGVPNTATKANALSDFTYSVSNNFYAIDNNVANDIRYYYQNIGTDNDNLIRTREGKDETVVYGNVADMFGGDAAHQASILAALGLTWYTAPTYAPLPGFFLVRINDTGASPHDEIIVGLTLSAKDPASRGTTKMYRSAYARIVLKDTNY